MIRALLAALLICTASANSSVLAQPVAPAEAVSSPQAWKKVIVRNVLGQIENGYRQLSAIYKQGEPDGNVVVVRFVVGPEGRVTSANIAKSSGNPRLDEFVLQKVQGAGLPPPPASVLGRSNSFLLPVKFAKPRVITKYRRTLL